MLVLSRKKDEKILLQVGDNEIELTVVKIDANKVRLGINANEDVTILRKELVKDQNPVAKVVA